MSEPPPLPRASCPPTGPPALSPEPGPLVPDRGLPRAPLFCLAPAAGTVRLPPASPRYSLFAALSGLMGEGLAPHLPQITTLMLLSLRSTEGIVVSGEWVGWVGWGRAALGRHRDLGAAEPGSLLCLVWPASV